ncbi:MAG: O-antigen ligase family protein [Fuscovulum sp.]|nr:MAG: O-antigen ligase family protein [Fuscovulum sp.]
MAPPTPHRSALSIFHDRLAIFLAFLVPLSAVPLASNRAAWWLLWSALFAALSALYLRRFFIIEPEGRLRFINFKWSFCMLLLVPLWGLLQSLPLGTWFPEELLALPNGLDPKILAAVSIQPYVAMSAVIRFAGYVFLAALVLEVARRPERVMLVGKIVFFGIVLQAAYALFALKVLGDFSPWGPKEQYAGSATGTFVNRNSLATFLGFGMILGIGLLAEQITNRRIRETRKADVLGRFCPLTIAVIIGEMFLFIALLATQSRLGLAASMCGVLTSLMVWRWIATRSLRLLIRDTVLSATFSSLLATSLSISEGVATRFLFTAGDGEDRLEIYRQAIGMIELRPITGFGLDTFSAAFEMFRGPPLDNPVHYDLAHNTYLALWAEAGIIVGSFPPMVLLLALVVLARRLTEMDGFFGFALAGIGSIVTAGVHSLGDFSLEIPANVYVFTTIVCLGLGYRSKKTVRGSTGNDLPLRQTRSFHLVNVILSKHRTDK